MAGLKRGAQRTIAGALGLPGVRGAARALGRAGVLPEAVWRRLPVTGLVAVEVAGAPVPVLYDAGLMDFLGRYLFFGGVTGWEPELARVLPTLARAATSVVDVGAHTGLFSLIALASNPQARAVALEPVLANAVLLANNLRRNGFGSRCTLVVAAASDALGPVPFDNGPTEIPMTSSINPSGVTGDGTRVLGLPLDAIAAWEPTGGRIDLVKVDVEGFEHLVLAGATRVLADHRPTWVIECLPGSRVEEFAAAFDSLGYRRYHLLADRVEPINRVEPSASAATHNYLFCARPEVAAQLLALPGGGR